MNVGWGRKTQHTHLFNHILRNMSKIPFISARDSYTNTHTVKIYVKLY